ncbi:hypothetical protein Q3V30_21500 (plasmid) [Erwinia pyri]|uniref:Uncharacterized protein n=1 Tax=Erwinia pyri TaxID=3062598 RepID=A0AA50DRU4_9GAMM|nr:hypothetical protein [Erwinia sp. DE2]WLS81060.1 hypothetical protein Q3V30_21500 [Erwinia sp. DE2]
MTLRPENAKRVPAENFERFWLPGCSGHLLVPDVGYGVPIVNANGVLNLGFRFKEEICSLHCYTVEDERISPVQTLTEAADALIAAVDNALSPFARTFGADV